MTSPRVPMSSLRSIYYPAEVIWVRMDSGELEEVVTPGSRETGRHTYYLSRELRATWDILL